jgi:Uncharacterized protein conserved in bacteria
MKVAKVTSMKKEEKSLEEIQKGFSFSAERDGYICLSCGEVFEKGEIFQIEKRFFEAKKAAALHVQAVHPEYLKNLITEDSKYNLLTENQQQLMLCFMQGKPDKDTARQLNISQSTVRHQKFMFREKAKQMRRYLAIYEAVFEKENGGDKMIPIHENAKMVDERFVITEDERANTLKTVFESLEPLKLKVFSRKEKKKVIILTKIAESFQPNREYKEPEVNEILKGIYHDFATIRRYLIEYGYLDRTKDGAKYWKTGDIEQKIII